MATAKQTDVTWIKKGQMVNGKKAAKGYLALRSAPGKAFSGTVTNVSKNTTSTRGGEAKYVNGRNVFKQAERRSAKVSGGKASTTSSSSYVSTTKKPKTTDLSYLPSRPSGVASTVTAAKKAKSPIPPVGRGASTAAAARPTALQAQIQRVTRAIAAKRREIDMRNKKAQKTTADAQATKRDREALANLEKQLKALK